MHLAEKYVVIASIAAPSSVYCSYMWSPCVCSSQCGLEVIMH